jgi:hypothetical protein
VPVLQVFAERTSDTRQRLDAMCLAVAHALDLRPEDVVGTYIEVTATTVAGTDASWPVVVLHGSRRSAAAMQAATDAVRDLAGEWSGSGQAGAWVTWQTAP